MVQRETDHTLEAILITFGFCSPDTVLSDLAQQSGLPLMLNRDLAAQVTGLIHTESVFRHQVLPVIITPFSLRVTIADPYNTAAAICNLACQQGKRMLRVDH